MDLKKIVGILLIVAGILALVYGGFSYTQDTHKADLGPVSFEVKEQKHVNIPVWGGVAAVIVGAVLLATGRRTGGG